MSEYSLGVLRLGYFFFHQLFVSLNTQKHIEMAKKQTEAASGKSKLEDALEALNKKYGVGTILSLGDKNHNDYDLISTGSIAFDHIALGVGGFVKGKLYELVGWEGSGKSTICGHAVANCQKNGGKVLYIDGEHAVDPNYFTALGVDISSMLIAQPSCGEEGFQIAMDMISTSEIDLVIIDSDSSLIPKKVLDGDVGDSSIGRKAKLNSDVYPKLKGMLSKHQTCVIVVSQYREKIGVMFGDPRTTQGGHALKFYSDVRVEVSKTLAKEGTEAYGNVTKIKTIKNKMAAPFKGVEFEIVFGVGIDRVLEIMDMANQLEILRKYGKTITYNETKHDVDEFRTLLEDNDEFFDKLRQDIIDKINEAETVNKIENEDIVQEVSAGSTEA
jgi:recombination protein RecA